MRRDVGSSARVVLQGALGLAVLLGASGARSPHAGPTPVRVLEPSVVLARYAAALDKLARPHAVSFEYVVEQLGLRTSEQRHRVYRRGLDERDETLIVDGYALSRPAVRIIRNRTYRYDMSQVAPRPEAYAFAFAGKVRAGSHFLYVFRTLPRNARAFAISEVAIDGSSFLPTVIRFKTAGGGARGRGELAYGKSESFWVVQTARVTARLPNGSAAREKITWLNYRFPQALPPSTFQMPKPTATEMPAETPADTPAS